MLNNLGSILYVIKLDNGNYIKALYTNEVETENFDEAFKFFSKEQYLNDPYLKDYLIDNKLMYEALKLKVKISYELIE